MLPKIKLALAFVLLALAFGLRALNERTRKREAKGKRPSRPASSTAKSTRLQVAPPFKRRRAES